MIDFAGVTALRVPEGNVSKIANAAGEIIWEKPGPMYTPCEYLQLDGGQYIDTGFICNQDTTVAMTFTREIDSARYLFGVASSNNKASVTGYLSGTNFGSWRFGATYARPSVTTNVKHTFSMDKEGIIFDGALEKYYGSVGTFTTPNTLVLGTNRSASGTIGTVRHIGKIYHFALLDGETPLMDCSPVVSADGVYGFWDSVSERFIESDGEPFEGG